MIIFVFSQAILKDRPIDKASCFPDLRIAYAAFFIKAHLRSLR